MLQLLLHTGLLLLAVQQVQGGFVFTTCKRGFERLLKQEVLTLHPELRFAYSRPGLITWKSPEDWDARTDFWPDSFFIRGAGVSVLSQAADASQVLAAAVELKAARCLSSPLRLHCFAREEDESLLSSEHPQVVADREARVQAMRSELLLSAPPGLFFGPQPGPAAAEAGSDNAALLDPSLDWARDGETVLDVVLGEPGDKTFVGAHVQQSAAADSASASASASAGSGSGEWSQPPRTRTGLPNNALRLALPAEAPSRAWLKTAEALAVLGLQPRAGDTAVEIGSAPGGSVFALLSRGLTVVGVDPCPSDRTHSPVIMRHPHFSEVRAKLHQLRRDQLPGAVQWLLCDANVDAEDAVPHLGRLCRELARPAATTAASAAAAADGGRGGSASASAVGQGSSDPSSAIASASAAPQGLQGLLYTCKLGGPVLALGPERVLQYLQSVREDLVLAAGGAVDGRRVRLVSLPSHRSEVLLYAPVNPVAAAGPGSGPGAGAGARARAGAGAGVGRAGARAWSGSGARAGPGAGLAGARAGTRAGGVARTGAGREGSPRSRSKARPPPAA